MNRLLSLLALCLLLGLAACSDDRDALPVLRTEIPFDREGTLDFLRPDGSVIATIDIEIAETDSAQARGLMDRRSLPPRSGMLFVNETAEPRSFWMKSTPMPLDILFIGADSQVVNIAHRTRPYSEAFIESDGPAQFVLELRAGVADQLGLDETTRLRWRRTDDGA